MKKTGLYFTAAMCFLLTGCSVVGGIFKAGMVWGIILVGLVIAAILALIIRGNKG